MPDTFLLEVATPEQSLVKEQVSEAQIPAANGYLGVLPDHAPLAAELGAGELSYQVEGRRRSLTVDGGWVEISGERASGSVAPVPPGLLGLVVVCVGPRDQLGGGLTLLDHGHADGDGRADGVAGPIHYATPHEGAAARRHGDGARCVGLGQNGDELLAAPSAEEVK